MIEAAIEMIHPRPVRRRRATGRGATLRPVHPYRDALMIRARAKDLPGTRGYVDRDHAGPRARAVFRGGAFPPCGACFIAGPDLGSVRARLPAARVAVALRQGRDPMGRGIPVPAAARIPRPVAGER